ncbi:MAG: hypothetical protein NVSMB23_10280 [Myxococcales bacterium]
MQKLARLATLSAALSLCACAPSLIPGTRIADKPETRAALDVLSKYKTASEALDAEAVLALAAPTYFDNGSASRTHQTVDYEGLQRVVPAEFEKLRALRMDITVKDARVQGDKAEIDYFLVLHYSIKLPSGEKWHSESDDVRLYLARMGGQWKVTSGL